MGAKTADNLAQSRDQSKKRILWNRGLLPGEYFHFEKDGTRWRIRRVAKINGSKGERISWRIEVAPIGGSETIFAFGHRTLKEAKAEARRLIEGKQEEDGKRT